MNSSLRHHRRSTTRPGNIMVKLVLLIVLTVIVAVAMLLVPRLLVGPEDKPTESLVGPAPKTPPSMAPINIDPPTAPADTPTDAPADTPPVDIPADTAADAPATPPAPPTPPAAPVATEDLVSSLPALDKVDDQMMQSPRQSQLLLPALRRYEIDLSKGQMLLNDVRDETEKFDEAPLYWVLNVCRTLPRQLFLPADGEHEESWTRLRQVPTTYRGWPITISGRVGSVTKWDLPHPEIIGIDRVWIIELYKPMTGGQRMSEVCTLFVTDDPGQLAVHSPIRARGFFFKIRKYELEHQVGRNQSEAWNYFSPVIIGKTFIAEAPAAVISDDAGALGPVVVVAMIVFLLIAFMFIRKLIAIRAKSPTEHAHQMHAELSEEERRQRAAYLDQLGRQPPNSPSS